jgi:hypothetical protein
MTKEKVPKREKRYPHWVFPTKRAFQRAKRANLRQVRAALSELQNGCAYLPGYREHWAPIKEHFDALFESARPGNWK